MAPDGVQFVGGQVLEAKAAEPRVERVVVCGQCNRVQASRHERLGEAVEQDARIAAPPRRATRCNQRNLDAGTVGI